MRLKKTQTAKAKSRVAKPRKKAGLRPARKVLEPSIGYEELSYEQALAKSVMDSEIRLECEDSATLAAAMSSLTLSMKKLSYNYGMSVGRSVYKLFEGRKHYRWYGDSIQDIVQFMERLGFNYILYRILTDNVEISVYRKGKSNMGCNIHTFDAGMIAGFLGEAKGDFVRVSEASCCNNGADCCRFTTGSGARDPFCTDVKEISRIVKGQQSAGTIRPEYHMLVAGPLMKREYSAQINSIFSHLGETAASELEGERMSAKNLQKASSLMERCGLGRLEYTPKPLKVAILLDGAKAKKEFVDISISFFNGMMARYFGKPPKYQLSWGKGSYRINVKQ